ncbi:TonB-dependent receptor [Rheinheimera sp. 1928-s]|uniref:TonB-dependent receptor n=1 Tax=Rheinheimera sp. 1928-s TaxID=3033803 RepID=UPI00260929A8|nr:TonB-dependent receptor [Rheinheimera sp. 1928-s]MDF3124387.1 TonB-dependent receptor [Rheinheimera sp. 1928-s]
MKLKHLALAVAFALGASNAAMANTSSAMRGMITTPAGAPAVGTKVTVIHVPTGSKTVVTANAGGVFNATGLRVGGPYQILVDSDTYSDETINDVFLTLNETSNINVSLQADTGVERIAVTGSRISALNLDARGPSSIFTAADIQNTPTIDRDIKSVVEQDPRITIDASNANAIQCAGGHNRSNSLTVDGLEMNDNFGLNSNGYPTERLPFPFDAIDQVAVELAPFDVTYGNFSGCAINAVTKSGTNEISGNVFVDYKNDSMQGDSIDGRDINVAPFSEKRYGFTLGMPLLEDELFFFAAYEKHNPSTVFSWGPTGSGFPSEIEGLDLATIQQVADIAQSRYGYTVAPLETQTNNNEEKVLLKLDWQINNDHRAFLTYQNTTGDTTATTDSGSTQFAFNDHFYTRANELTSYSTQFFSDWTEAFSTSVRVSYQEVINGQDPRTGQGNFGHFQINNVNGNRIHFGPDQFRHANELAYDTFNLNAQGKYFYEDHEITGGFEYKTVSIFNMFVPQSKGYFQFNSLADFEAGIASSIGYSNAASLNPADAAAEFKLPSYALFIQDQFSLTDDLSVTLGLRWDRWTADSRPNSNANFATRYGFDNAQKLDLDLFQPRLGVNYIVDDTMVVYGGIGLFSGGNPNVWISNIYSNDGVAALASSTAALPADIRTAALNAANTPNFGSEVPDILKSPTYLRGGDGNVASLDPNFKAPANWKFNVGTQKELTEDLVIGADLILSKEKDPLKTVDLRLQSNGTAPDGRPIYRNCVVNVADISGACVSRNNWDLLLTNSDESGLSKIASTFVDWTIAEGLKARFSYAYQSTEETHPMTSTTANSNYDRLVTDDPLNPTPAPSNYETPNRFTLNLNYSANLIDGYPTNFNVFAQRTEGRAYSYTFIGDPGFGDALGRSRDRNLLYVPTANDSKVVYGADFDLDAFNSFIADNGLEGNRGGIAPRNGSNSDWWTRVDLKVTQEIPAFSEEHQGLLYFSIMNVGNLLNDEWGSRRQIGFHYQQAVVAATMNDDGQYVYETFRAPRDQSVLDSSSVWSMVLGLEYKF